MRRFFIKSAFSAALTMSIFSFFGCKDLLSMEIPEKVSVATDAEFNVTLGTLKYNLSDSLSSAAITEKMQSGLGDRMKLFNYIQDDDVSTEKDESDILTYVLRYPVYEVPVDVGSYLKDLDFDGTFSSTDFGFNFDQTISVPSVSSSSSSPIGLDFMDEFKSTMNTNFETENFDIDNCYEPGIKAELETNHGSIKITAEAEKTYFKTGSALEIKFTKKDTNECSADFEFEGKGFLSSDGSNADLGSSDFVSVKNGGTISIPLDRAEGLPSEFYICLTGRSSGGSLTVQHSYAVTMALSSASELKKVENVKKTSAELGIDPVTFNMEVDTAQMQGLFNSATIKTGKIELYTSPITGWSGVTSDIEFTFAENVISGSDLQEGTKVENAFFDKVADISGTSITPSATPIEISGSAAIEVQGATIDFTTDVSSVVVNYDYEITELSDVVVDLTSDKYSNIQTSYALNTDGTGNNIELTEELTQYVKTINFGTESSGAYYKHNSSGNLDINLPAEGLGFKFKLINTLDTDDLSVHVKSEKMNYDLTKTLATTTEAGESQNWVQYPTVNFTGLDTSVKNYVDFAFEFTSTTITLNTLTLGKDYKLALEFEKMIYDWDSVTLKTDSTSMQGEQNLENINLSSLLDGLSLGTDSIKNINIGSLPVFFYAQKPTSTNTELESLLNSISISGNISIDYVTTDAAGTPTTYSIWVLGSSGTNKTLNFMADSVPWPENASTTITSDALAAKLKLNEDSYSSSVIPYITEANTDKYSFTEDLADIINSYPESLNFKYSLALGAAGTDTVVYSSMLSGISSGTGESESTTSDTSIKIDMAIVLSFNLDLTGDITVDIMDFYSEDWETSTDDLLSRDDASTYEKFAEYCDAIDSFAMYYTVDNGVFKGLDLRANFSDPVTGINKEITLLENKTNVLSFTSQEIEKVLTMYPFHPSATMTIVGGTAASPKSLTMSRSQIDSKDGAYLGASAQLKLDLSNRAYINIWGD